MNNFDINSLLSSFGFFYITQGQVIMLFVGLILLYLAINKKFEPLLLVPIGFGTILSNIPEIGLAYSGLEKIIFENAHSDGTRKKGENYKKFIEFISKKGYIVAKEDNCDTYLELKQ